MVFFAFAFSILVNSGTADAGADPDAHRKVANGVEPYATDTVQVGGTYEAFLIAFTDRSEVYLSPSRYRVSYIANALTCRNTDEVPIDQIRDGQWWTVVFEVLAVKETAIEDPPASGKWTWQHSYDCIIKDLQHAR